MLTGTQKKLLRMILRMKDSEACRIEEEWPIDYRYFPGVLIVNASNIIDAVHDSVRSHPMQNTSQRKRQK